MAFWGPVIGGAIGALGSFLGSTKGAEEQVEGQREFAQNSLQWRVEDAKKAGVHPLFALGAQLPSYQPIMVGGEGLGTALGAQALGSGVAAGISDWEDSREWKEFEKANPGKVMSPMQRMVMQDSILKNNAAITNAQVRQEANRADMSDMDLAAARRAFMNNNEHNALKPDPLMPWGYKTNELPYPNPQAKFRTAGPPSAFFKPYQMRGFVMDLPEGSSASEAMEAISESYALGAAIIAHNISVYGPEWKGAFLKEYPWAARVFEKFGY